MKLKKLYAGAFFVVIAINLIAAQNSGQKTPQHPSKLKYDSLTWKVPLGEPFRVAMKNGLVAYIAEDTVLPLVQITGYVKYGSLSDPAEKTGLSSLMTTVMRTGGTQKYPADSLNELIDRLALKIGLSAGESSLSFSAAFLSDYTEQALEILDQILFYPAFDDNKLEKERKIMIEGIKHRFDNPGPALKAAYQKLMYTGEEASRLATEKTVKSLSKDDLITLHKKVFTPKNMIFSMAGNFKRDSTIQKIEKLFSTVKDNGFVNTFPQIDITSKNKCIIVQKPITQAYVRMGLPLFKRPNPDYYAMTLLNEILGGGGFTSRLGEKIRSDAGLTYSIYSNAESNYTYPGTFYIDFFTKNASFSQAVAMSIDIIRGIIADGVTTEELTSAKSSLTSELPSMFRSPFDIVSTYAYNEYYGRSQDHYKIYPDELNKITREDVQRVAKQYLTPDNFTYTVVGDTTSLMNQESAGFSLSKISKKTVVSNDSLPLLP